MTACLTKISIWDIVFDCCRNTMPTKSPDQHPACISELQGQSSALSSTSNDIVWHDAEVFLWNLDKINQEMLAVLEKLCRHDDVSLQQTR